MSHISTVIMDLLKANAGVVAKVGTRIYPDALPSNVTLPAISVVHVDGVPDQYIPAVSTDRIQVSCFSNPTEYNGVKSPQEVEEVAQAVKTALHKSDLEKSPISGTVNGVVHTITKAPRLLSERRFREEETDWYHIPLDFSVTYRKD